MKGGPKPAPLIDNPNLDALLPGSLLLLGMLVFLLVLWRRGPLLGSGLMLLLLRWRLALGRGLALLLWRRLTLLLRSFLALLRGDLTLLLRRFLPLWRDLPLLLLRSFLALLGGDLTLLLRWRLTLLICLMLLLLEILPLRRVLTLLLRRGILPGRLLRGRSSGRLIAVRLVAIGLVLEWLSPGWFVGARLLNLTGMRLRSAALLRFRLIAHLHRRRHADVAVCRERLAGGHAGRAAMVDVRKLRAVPAGGLLILHLSPHGLCVSLAASRQLRRSGSNLQTARSAREADPRSAAIAISNRSVVDVVDD